MMRDSDIVTLMKVPAKDHDLEWLKCSLQAALILEFATIPPYLCAYWSVQKSTEVVAGSILTIVMEEMLHMGIICNLFVAIENTDSPDFLKIPTYPGPLPGCVHPGLEVLLQGLSKESAKLFMDIELPEHGPIALVDQEYPTIGAFYTAIQTAFETLDPPLSQERQLEELSIELVKLRTKQDVLEGIELIKRQGEGSKASPEDTGADDLAHYYRFGEIYNGKKLKQDPMTGKWSYSGDSVDMPACWPMGKVPLGGYTKDDVKPEVWERLAAFDAKFTSMVRNLQLAWQNGDQKALENAVRDMRGLKKPAVELMKIQIPSMSVNYGPCFRLVPQMEMLPARRKSMVLSPSLHSVKENFMDPKLLPADLRPEKKKTFAANEFPVTQTNPITGYRTSLYRSGKNPDFLGWIELMNGNKPAGYIYIQRPLESPYLGSSRYIVMDFAPELLESLLRTLQSSEKLQIRFYQGAANVEASAFLEHGADSLRRGGARRSSSRRR
jgi:hypothetical protein